MAFCGRDDEEYDEYYDELDDWDDGLFDGDYGVNAAPTVTGNSAGTGSGLSGEDKAMVGTRFTTGNEVVRQLPVGSILEVIGERRLEVVEVPAKQLEIGDRFTSKYGPATVVRLSSRIEGEPPLGEGEVFYIADGTTVVRRQFVN